MLYRKNLASWERALRGVAGQSLKAHVTQAGQKETGNTLFPVFE